MKKNNFIKIKETDNKHSIINDKLKILADCSPALLWMCGEDSSCIFTNQTWVDFTGRSFEQQMGLGWAQPIHPDDYPKAVDDYMKYFNARVPFELEYRFLHKSGEYRWLLDRGAPYYSNGIFLGFVGSCTDITELKHAESEKKRQITLLKNLNNKLEIRNKELKEFSNVVAHDLKAPLRHISLSLDMLLEDNQDNADKASIKEIQKTVQKMDTLINDLLTLSLIGTTCLKLSKISLKDTVYNTLKIFEAELNLINATIHVGNLPTVVCDNNRMEQLFQNLIQNAIKFRHSDRNLTLSFTAHEHPNAWEICIIDNGIGIDKKYADYVFKAFKKIEVNSESQGTGIGLSVCARIMELHDGTIKLESSPGQGSKFICILPKNLSDKVI